MRVLLKNELKKGVQNPLFLFALVLGLIFTSMSALSGIEYYENSFFKAFVQEANRSNYVKYNIVQSDSLYKYWIGADVISVGANLFYTLFPLLACLPCGSSLLEDIQSAYIKNIVPKTGRKNYFLAKGTVAFLIGGVSVLIPMIANVMLVSMYIPAIQMNVLYNEFFQIQHGNSFSVMAYHDPFLHMVLYLFICFMFGGICALLSTTMAFYTSNKLLAITFPFLLFLFSNSLETFSVSFHLPILSLTKMLKAVPVFGVMKIQVMLLYFVLLTTFSVLSIWKGGKNIEVF